VDNKEWTEPEGVNECPQPEFAFSKYLRPLRQWHLNLLATSIKLPHGVQDKATFAANT